MRNLIVFLNTGYCGEDAVDALAVVNDATDDEINAEVYQMAVDNAETYGRYITQDDEELEDEDERYEEYMLESTWEDYNPEVHDDLRSGGGSFSEDFAQMENYGV